MNDLIHWEPGYDLSISIALFQLSRRSSEFGFITGQLLLLLVGLFSIIVFNPFFFGRL